MITTGSDTYRFLNMVFAAISIGLALVAWTIATGGTGSERLMAVAVVLLVGLAPTGRPALGCRAACCQLQAVRAISIATVSTLGGAAVAWTADSLPNWGAIATIELAVSAALVASLCLAVCTRRPTRVAVLGINEFGIATARRLAHEAAEAQVVGFVDDNPHTRTDIPLPFPVLTRLDPSVADLVVIALPDVSGDDLDAWRARLAGHRVEVMAAMPPLRGAPSYIGDTAVLRLGPRRLTWAERAAKRTFDIAFASVALALMAPVMVACAVAIRIESPGPIIYRQRRYTTDGRLFVLYKFRSMRSDPEPTTEIRLTDRQDSRVTRVGAFLRRTSLDELPQFLNVLEGHMSVVGPRPHPPGVKVGERVYEDVIANFADRYVVKPGITGWAQVSGLRGSTFTERHLEERFSADLEYIRNWCLSLEILIVLKTVFGGFAGKNAF